MTFKDLWNSAEERDEPQRCGNAFFHRTTNVAGKIGPDNWPKNHLGGRGLMVPRFARAVLRSGSSGSGSSGSGLTWLRPHMALAIDHVRVMQRVAGPEA